MRHCWSWPILLGLVVAAAPVLAVGEPTPEELQVNRRLLERWRGDPEHYARLKRDYRAFMALPADKRDRLREFDRDLRDEDGTTQARLMRVLDRYTMWLERLPEGERARVESAPDSAERLKVVKELREREWIAHLPLADQERIKAAPADQQPKLIADLRQDERNRRREWQVAFWNSDEQANRPGNPTRPSEFPPETRLYINTTLIPMLSFEERTRLRETESKWPDYARLIWDLAQAHKVVKFPPSDHPVPLRPMDYKPGDIPDEIQRLLSKKLRDLPAQDRKDAQRLFATRGRWPDFPLAVAEVAREKNIPLKKPLGPCRLEDLHKAVRDFYFDKMVPTLKKESPEELEKLTKASGTWPEYPNLFMELAQKHKLQVPGTFLGGPPELWKAARGE